MTNTFCFILVGPARSGKTTYLKLLAGNSLPTDYESTLGVQHESLTQKLNNAEYTLRLWEIGSKFPQLAESYVPNAHVILVFCNLNEPNALTKIMADYNPENLKQKNPKSQLVLIGTHKGQPLIDENSFEDYALSHQFSNYDTVNLQNKREIRTSFAHAIENVITALQQEAEQQQQAAETQRLQKMEAARKQLIERKRQVVQQIEAYCRRRRGEIFNSWLAVLASFLGLSCYFGHSTASDKMIAANALIAALKGSKDKFNHLTVKQKAALRNGRLFHLYDTATRLIPELETDQVSTPSSTSAMLP